MRRLALWGQHLDEYRDMFDLKDDDLNKRFLEYNSGASAFNFELHNKSLNCVSCDPWFNLDKNSLEEKINTNFDERMSQLESNLNKIDVSRYGSFEKLISYRRLGMESFLADYESGLQSNRYMAISEDHLPFSDFSFDFALVANNFFADLDFHTVDHHLGLIKELAKVAKEVRIFPLVDSKGEPSPLLGPILLGLNQDNYGVEVRDVSYHLQPRGNAMLRIWAQQCEVHSSEGT
ncbi:MAG: hypothetical protein P1U74_05525 [Legionellaceae bacterium]|nr:hypothetical protein [Legionellaceae bacterium]